MRPTVCACVCCANHLGQTKLRDRYRFAYYLTENKSSVLAGNGAGDDGVLAGLELGRETGADALTYGVRW